MRVLVIPVLVAVIASVAVIVAAAAVSADGQGVRDFFRDLRGGLSARFGAGRDEAPAEELEPVDTSLDDFFAATTTQESAYVAADGLASTIEKVADGVARARH